MGLGGSSGAEAEAIHNVRRWTKVPIWVGLDEPKGTQDL
jgi:hypothetical protein